MKMVTQHSEKLAKPFVFFISNFFMPDSFSPNVVGGKRKMCATVFSSRNSFLLPSPHTTGVLLPTFSSSSSPSYSSSYSSHTSHTSSHVLIKCVCQEQICFSVNSIKNAIFSSIESPFLLLESIDMKRKRHMSASDFWTKLTLPNGLNGEKFPWNDFQQGHIGLG